MNGNRDFGDEPSKLVIFDLDGTLVDTAPDLLLALNATLETISQPPIELATIRDFVGKGAKAMIVRALEHNGVDPAAYELGELFDHFLAHYDANICVNSTPFRGVVECLIDLDASGYSLAVCTNKRQALAEKLLDLLSLSEHFLAIVGADTVEKPKPDRNHIDETVKRAGFPPETAAIMIGDSATDLNAAKAGDIPCLLHEFGYSETPIFELGATGTFGDYSTLPQTIAALFSSLAPSDE